MQPKLKSFKLFITQYKGKKLPTPINDENFPKFPVSFKFSF